jgi:hypothetical protein
MAADAVVHVQMQQQVVRVKAGTDRTGELEGACEGGGDRGVLLLLLLVVVRRGVQQQQQQVVGGVMVSRCVCGGGGEGRVLVLLLLVLQLTTSVFGQCEDNRGTQKLRCVVESAWL